MLESTKVQNVFVPTPPTMSKATVLGYLIKQYPACVVGSTPHSAILVDGTMQLHSIGNSRRSPGGAEHTPTNDDVLIRLSNLFDQLFMRTNTLYFAVDQTPYVPLAKAHVQAKRNKTTALPEYEMLFPGNAGCKAVEQSRKSQFEKQKIELQRENTAASMTLLDMESPSDVIVRKMGLDRPPSTRELLEASRSFYLPRPWQDAVSGANRCKTMRYITRMLTESNAAYNPPVGKTLILDGHARLDNQDVPLVLEWDKRLPRSMHPSTLGYVPGAQHPRPVVTSEWTLENQLGEADAKIIHTIDRLYDCGKGHRTFEVVTADTDATLQCMWYLARLVRDTGQCPEVVVNRYSATANQFLSVNKLMAELIRDYGQYIQGKHDPFVVVTNVLVVCFAHSSDYTTGYSEITGEKMLETLRMHHNYVGNLCVSESMGPGSVPVVCPAAYVRLVLCSYYVKYQKHFEKSLYNTPAKLSVAGVIGVTSSLVAADWRPFVAHPERCPTSIDKFKSMMSNLAKRCPPAQQIAHRFWLLQYYVFMVHQYGDPSLRLDHVKYYDYATSSPDGEFHRKAVSFMATNDYENRHYHRQQYVMNALQNGSQ